MNDLIGRQAAKEAYCKHFCHLYCYRDTLCSDNLCKEVNEAFDKLPPAQPERKTGRWVSQKGGGYCCSECGRYALDEVDGNFIHVAFESNFCPYCGAEMIKK